MSLALLLSLAVNQLKLLVQSFKEGGGKAFFYQFLNGMALITVSFVVFILYLPLIIQVILFLFIFIVILVAIVAVMGTIAGLGDNGAPDGSIAGGGSFTSLASMNGGRLSFTQQELDAYGSTLTGYEKNIYRLGILTMSNTANYKGTTTFADLDKYVNGLFLLGIASTETGMRFYPSKEEDTSKNIIKDPSTKGINSSGFGTMGLCGRKGGCGSSSKEWTLSQLKAEESEYLTSTYGKPSRTMDINFYPYATYFSFKHLEGKTTITDKYIDKAMDVLKNQWDVKSNLEEHRAVIYHLMLQAAYHGVNFAQETEHYANFWGALLHSTSAVESERSFYKVTKKTSSDYSESSMRKSMFGAGGCHNFPKNSDPNSWNGISSSATLVINGEEVAVPLWTHLYNKYKDHSGFKASLNRLTSWASNCSTTGASARVLNFHYGLNSFIQGNSIVTTLAEKMGVPEKQPQVIGSTATGGTNMNINYSGGVVTPVNKTGTFLKANQKLRTSMVAPTKVGVAQGTVTIKGKTQSMQNFLDSHYGSNANYQNRKKHFGTSAYIEKKHYFNRNKLTAVYEQYNFFNVPHSMQSNNNVNNGESYTSLSVAPGASVMMASHGCMFYAVSYVASAISGHFINPIEMGAYLKARNYIASSGYSMDQNHGKAVQELTGGAIKYKYIEGGKGATIEQALKEVAKFNAMAIIRLGGKYAYGINHYVVITGVVKGSDGSTMYTMMSSSPNKDSTRLHSLAELKANPGNGGRATVFYY